MLLSARCHHAHTCTFWSDWPRTICHFFSNKINKEATIFGLQVCPCIKSLRPHLLCHRSFTRWSRVKHCHRSPRLQRSRTIMGRPSRREMPSSDTTLRSWQARRTATCPNRQAPAIQAAAAQTGFKRLWQVPSEEMTTFSCLLAILAVVKDNRERNAQTCPCFTNSVIKNSGIESG